jgi:hypothetical protein
MTKRLAGLVAGALGVAGLLWGLLSNHWVVGKDAGIESHVGLRSIELCQMVRPDLSLPGERACSRVSHTEILGSPSAIDGFETFSIVSRITLYAGLACAAVILLLLVLGALGRTPDLPIAPSTLGIVLSAGTILLIAITLAIHPWKSIGWGTGYSIMVSGAGSTACLLAAILLGRVLRPVNDDW